MTTVETLIQWLLTQDPNKKVFVMHEIDSCGGYGTDVYFEDLRLPTEENKYDVNVDVFRDEIRFGERG